MILRISTDNFLKHVKEKPIISRKSQNNIRCRVSGMLQGAIKRGCVVVYVHVQSVVSYKVNN